MRAGSFEGPSTTRLILEVRVNGQASDLLWEFEQFPDGRLATTAGRLIDLGFDLGSMGDLSRDRMLLLDDLSGIAYRYDVARQTVEIDAEDRALVPVILDMGTAPETLEPDLVESGSGVVLGYGVHAGISGDGIDLSANYDLRLLSNLGVVTTNGFVRHSSRGVGIDHVRLDTHWRYVDARRVLAFSIGDVIGYGGDLGTVYRLGGVQVRRNFADRPDIVTTAVPILAGSAAVPSAIDLYINGTRLFTGRTGPGPFEFRSLPNIGNGVATIVMTDALGRETRVEKTIFFAPELLARGVLDFSAEAGFPRFNYGIASFDYLSGPAGSATVRYGLADWVTVEGHVEGADDFVNGSVAAVLRLGSFGVLRGMAAASRFDRHTRSRYVVEARGHLRGINLYGGIERSGAGYHDIVRDVAIQTHYGPEDGPDRFIYPDHEPVLLAFSEKRERAGVNFSLLNTGVSFDYTRARLPGQDVKLASVSLSRSLFGVSLWARGFKDLGDRKDYGIFAGFSLSFANGVSGSGSVAASRAGTVLTARASRTPRGFDDRFGWSVINAESISGRGDSYRAVSVRYEGRDALVEGGAELHGNRFRGNLYVEGSLVAMGGGLFASRRIDNSFAIVTGAGARTPVVINSRPITRTDGSGRALVPFLSSFQANVVGIDPTDLPIDQQPARTRAVVVPGDRAGVLIDFGVARTADAIVILVDDGGSPLPLGSFVSRGGEGEDAIVGYDGRAFLTGLSPRNHIRVQREGAADCIAEFTFEPQPGRQVVIGPVPCR